jgi:hypothetical protein
VGDWRIRSKRDLKNYPHFDSVISAQEAEALATDPKRVATHAFYPFLLYTKHWTRYADRGQAGKKKDRPIRYAARRDAYIFSRYRHLLSEAYETALASAGLHLSILAYRRIPAGPGQGGKCNIHFARDAILKVREVGNCAVLALDVSSYFESLDHAKLKAIWCRMLGANSLPADHFQVFTAITRYAVVDKRQVYERLGHFGEKRQTKSGKLIPGFLTPFRRIPKQLCRGQEFRDKIAGGDGQKSLIKVNRKPYGIPQGAPISDLLANIYLFDFDQVVARLVADIGGAYYRYSDDILIVVPGGASEGRNWLTKIQELIHQHGEKLVIKAEKSFVCTFERDGDGQKFCRILGTQGANGMEYLGFRYDGRRVYLRDSTLSGLWRKVTFAARRDAKIIVEKYPHKGESELRDLFNFERLVKEFGKVEDFGEKHEDYRNWTFWTYARRASEIFGPLGDAIPRQLKRYEKNVKIRANQEIAKAVERRDSAPAADDI